VHQAVQDAVRDGGIPDLLVPARDRQLGSEDGGPSLVAIFADFPDFAALALDDNGGCRGGGTRFAGDVLAFTKQAVIKSLQDASPRTVEIAQLSRYIFSVSGLCCRRGHLPPQFRSEHTPLMTVGKLTIQGELSWLSHAPCDPNPTREFAHYH